jgi:hypothetical protein
MPRRIMMDEIIVRVYLPGGLAKAEYRAARRALNSKTWKTAFRKAVLAAFRGRAGLRKVKVVVQC